MTNDDTDTCDPAASSRRAPLRAALVPRLPLALLIMSGACTLSVAIALASAFAGHGTTSPALLALPPGLAAAGIGVWLARAAGATG